LGLLIGWLFLTGSGGSFVQAQEVLLPPVQLDPLQPSSPFPSTLVDVPYLQLPWFESQICSQPQPGSPTLPDQKAISPLSREGPIFQPMEEGKERTEESLLEMLFSSPLVAEGGYPDLHGCWIAPVALPDQARQEKKALERESPGEVLLLSEGITASPDPSGEMASDKLSPGNTPPSKGLASIRALINEKVKEFIDFFQTKADGYFIASLARSQAYEGMMKEIFRKNNLPEELFYLALIESGYNPYAVSRAKASGIWQFTIKTARRYGLKVDKWVDERRDPEKSTHAAAHYLKDLFETFKCWYLTAASYNAGEGKLLQAMRRAKSNDFWEISKYRYLKRETKQYVPMFLAATIIAQNPQKYGFSQIDYHPPLVYEKVLVPPGTRLDRIARAAETDLSVIRALNPSLRRDKTPPDGPPFEIKIPPGKKETFEENFSTWKQSHILNAKRHRVRQGETLGQIARKYRLSLEELCQFNQISPKAIIRPGLILLLPP